jgi:glycosyltransferase involved in cell wall biosynthesis
MTNTMTNTMTAASTVSPGSAATTMTATTDTTTDRFAIFLPALSGGGAERAMVNLAGGLVSRAVAVDLVLGMASGPYMASVPAGVNVVSLGTNKLFRKARALAQYLKAVRPRGMVASLDNVNVACLARKLAGVQTRILQNVQNNVSSDLASHGGVKGRLKMKLLAWTYPLADGVVAVSHGVAADLVDNLGLPRDLVGVIHNPMMNAKIGQLAIEPVDHPFFNDATGVPVLIGVGRLTLQKDFPTLLRAFALVRKQRPVRLVILGEGELRASLEALATELGVRADVAMPGFCANPYAYLAKAAAFVLSSSWEGLPTVVMEALATGTPIVSTDCPSGPHEILDGGKFGELVPMADPPAMAEAIGRVLSTTHDRDRLRARAQLYSADLSVDRYLLALDPDRTSAAARDVVVKASVA